jgi:hypothetical protein
LCEKLAGIKQKLSSAIVIMVSALVTGYDFFAPIVSGVNVSSIAAQVPSWAWPLILIAVTALFQFLRNLSPSGTKSNSKRVARAAGEVTPCGSGLRASSAGQPELA